MRSWLGALAGLPVQPWQWATFKTVKMRIDYRVEVEGHRYSVPHALVGLALAARITDVLVETLHRGQRVACHARNSRLGGFTTLDERMPAAHRTQKRWPPERLIHRGRGIGEHSGRFVSQRLARYRDPEHGFHSCLGLLSPTCWRATSPPMRPIARGRVTAPTSPPARVGCTWPWCRTGSTAKSWAGRSSPG